MTVSDTQTEEWKALPGFSSYQASHRGLVRSVDRIAGGRQLRGVVLKPRRSNRGYLLVNLTDDNGKVQTRSVHTLVLLAHVGTPEPGQETRHLNDNPEDNRWPENLAYGTPEENVEDRKVNSPAAPKPERHCVRCGGLLTSTGRRCHPCVVAIGQEAARRLAAGEDPDQVALALDYPSTVGVWRLAVKHGGARVVIAGAGPEIIPVRPHVVGRGKPPLLQRVTTTVRDWLAGRDPE
jgi:hypothetical protein